MQFITSDDHSHQDRMSSDLFRPVQGWAQLSVCDLSLQVLVVMCSEAGLLPLLTFIACSVVFCTMSMQSRVDQRTVIKFLVAQGATPIMCWRQLNEVYGDQALGKTQTRFWHKKFREGNLDTVTKDAPRSGRARSGRSALHIDKIRTQLDQDKRQSVRDLADKTGIPKMTVQRVL